jgi:hypothetical protein
MISGRADVGVDLDSETLADPTWVGRVYLIERNDDPSRRDLSAQPLGGHALHFRNRLNLGRNSLSGSTHQSHD